MATEDIQAKRWCFTLNNYDNQDKITIKNIECVYQIVGREIGKQGTKHLQGYIEFKGGKRLSTLKKINPRIHWEKCKGNQKQNIAYCSKSGKFWTRGKPKEQGKRWDLIKMREHLGSGGNLRTIITGESNLQVIRTAEKYLEYCEDKRDETTETEVTWVYGPSGSGKTSLIKKATEELDTYEKDDTKWWTGYDKHECVLIDDFSASMFKFKEFLKIIDRWSYRVETKGGHRQLLAKKIFITSINHPSEYYNNIPGEPIKQILRRIKHIIALKGDGGRGNTSPTTNQYDSAC